MTSPSDDRTALPPAFYDDPTRWTMAMLSAKDAEITALREQVAQLTQERDELIVSVHNLDRINAMVRERAEHAEALPGA